MKAPLRVVTIDDIKELGLRRRLRHGMAWRRTRIWQWLILALLVLLMTESIYAWWIGNR